METIAEVLLRMRMMAYPFISVCGFLLGVIAMGRRQYMHGGRRQLYAGLASIAFSLAWLGLWGVAGVIQYGTVVQGFIWSLLLIGSMWSVGIIWLSISISIVAIHLIYEELVLAKRVTNHGT